MKIESVIQILFLSIFKAFYYCSTTFYFYYNIKIIIFKSINVKIKIIFFKLFYYRALLRLTTKHVKACTQ